MASAIRQISRWKEGDLTSAAVMFAVEQANPRNEEDIRLMDVLAQKLRCALLSAIPDGTNATIAQIRQGSLRPHPVALLWFRRYEVVAAWLREHAPAFKIH